MPKNRTVVLLLFVLGTVLIYLPVLGNGFLTDDYAALYRLLVEKRVLYREFMRPLIDISFYLNWLISGLHPLGYYLFNLLVHAFTCFMVYRVAMDLPLIEADRRDAFALTAGLLFLFYPFHNEGVVWLAGRLSSMAALSALLAIHFSLRRRRPWGFWLAAFCWFAGLFAYESTIVLPALILVLEWLKGCDRRRLIRLALAWTAAGVVWLGMRVLIAGQLLPAYGESGMKGDGIALRAVKVFGRCFLPPMEGASGVMIGLFVCVLLLMGAMHVLGWRRMRRRKAGLPARFFLSLEAVFLLSLIPAIVFAVSTRTSEGDRLLYFPSCFFCMLASAVLVFFVEGRRWRWGIGLTLAVVGVVLIEVNNRHWVFASKTANALLDLVRATPGRVVLVNAPDEWEGAFIFRNNFKEGLVVNGIDPTRVVVTHFLMRTEYLAVNGAIEPEQKDGEVYIYPATRIAPKGVKRDSVYYWNKFQWKQLILN